MLASGQRGQPLDVDAEQLREGVGLGLAQLGELRRDMPDRAVTLAHLDTGQAADRHRARRRGETIAREGLDQSVGLRGQRAPGGGEVSGIPALQLRGPTASKSRDSFTTGTLPQEPQDLDRKVVVIPRERIKSGWSGNPLTSRTSAATRSRGTQRRLSLDDGTVSREGIEVATHRGRSEFQLAPQRRRADRPARGDRREHAVTRSPLRPRHLDIHYTSMA